LVQKLSRLLAYLEAGDRDGLLATLCELVPESVQPLRSFQGEVARQADPSSNGSRIRAWESVIESAQKSWRDRRGTMAVTPSPDLHLNERRQGLVCRRKAVRAGGRRRTDVGALLPTGSSAAM
jgi:hypothetical protein